METTSGTWCEIIFNIDSEINQVGDSVCLMLLTPLATLSAYLCYSGASYYVKQGQVAEAVSG